MIAVTVLSVTFATRGAMATNRPIVEVLHYVGATDGFIASQFQRHFLLLGFKGGAIGGGGALVLFAIMAAVNAVAAGTPGGDEAAALFGTSSVGLGGYLGDLRPNRAHGRRDGFNVAPYRRSDPREHRVRGGNKLHQLRQSPL